MTDGPQVRTTALTFATAILLATRIPGDGLSPWLAGAVAGVTLLLPAYNAWKGTTAVDDRAPAILMLLLAAVPPSPGSILGFAPSWAITLVVLPALHVFLRSTSPGVGADKEDTSRFPVTQALALLALTAAVLAGPALIASVLPDRLASLQALQGSTAPLLVAGALILLILVVRTVREARGPPGSADPGSPEPREADAP